MSFHTLSNIPSIDRQLILLAIELKNKILNKENYSDDKYFAKLYELAQSWDKLFQDSLAPRKGA